MLGSDSYYKTKPMELDEEDNCHR